MRNINLRYVDETYDDKGVLRTYKLKYPESFNFGYDVVDDIAVNDPDRVAMIWCDTKDNEKVFTFKDIKRYSDKTANYFKSIGITKGDMVAVILKRHYQFWYVSVALHKIGAVMIPITFMITAHDAEYRINAASVKAVICTSDGQAAQAVDEVESICKTLKNKIMVCREQDTLRQGWEDLDANVEAASEKWEKAETNIYDPFLMYFSSGTSGYPKMVLHNQTYALAHLFTAKHWHNVDPNGLHLTIADTGWGKAVWGKLYGQWLMESAVFVYDYDKFEAGKILSLIKKYSITSLCCPPTMFRFLIKEGLEKYDLSSLKYVTTAGEALNPDVFNSWYEATGLKLMEGFGQTETTVAVCNLKGMTPKPGSIGKPSPQYQVELMDNDGNPCPNGVTGEIVIKCDPHPEGLMDCYYRNEDRTKEAMFNGYYHTGDTAWRDEDGYFWFVGRNDDIIKSSGYRIGPFEIESVLNGNPKVLESAVTGVPDEIRGMVVKATIVLAKGQQPSEELKKELQDYVKHETAPYKYPRIIEFVSELPKTINGKIRRQAIREKDTDK
ncbi:MAG: AMP-binding protein [Candidatus Cloacimonetes bacterium]|nr:AMP-binding protein [Candidatus Cloacimonadota bacterium]